MSEETTPEVSAAVERADMFASDPVGRKNTARMLAQMLYNLRSLQYGCEMEMMANRFDGTRVYSQQVPSPTGAMVTEYLHADDGDAEDPDGRACESYAQRIEKLGKGIADMWADADRKKVRGDVEQALATVQEQALKRQEQQQG